MKKRIITFITVILSVIMSIAGFSGCGIVTSNTERDLDQVIATVNVNRQENIYKKDLVMGYLNYGYIYTQYYGYDAAKTYNLILNNLIDNRIMVQVAYEKFENGDTDAGIAKRVNDDTKSQYTPERYLTAKEITDAQYSTYKSINDLLDGYSEDKSNTEKKDGMIYDVRTVPTDAKNAEKELDKAAKEEYVAKGFDVSSNEYRRAAFNKVVKLLKDNGLLGSDYNGKITETEYFNRLLKSNYESKIIEAYENSIKENILKGVEYDDLVASYNEKLGKQQAWSNSDFVSALSSASATSPILYSAFGKYGYVYNLLLGVNDYQSEQISELQEERTHEVWTEEKYALERKEVLKGTIAKDLRSSWILSGYDFDFGTKKFTGDYTFAKDAANSLDFQGNVTKLRDADDEKGLSAIYKVDSVKTFGLDEFIAFVNDYVYNNESLVAGATDNNIYAAYTRADKPAEYDAKMNELLFAFSTDSGSLNTYKGYVIKPENTEYVKTFGDAGKALLEEGGSSYKVVASDYGYHFMFFSEVWNGDDVDKTKYSDLNKYLDSLGIVKGDTESWEEYFNAQKKDIATWEKFEKENNFLYFLANELISTQLTDATTRERTDIVTKYRYGEKKDSTVIYKDRFADLLG